MSQPTFDLDVQYHVDGLQSDERRFEQAARWVADQFELQHISASISVVDDPAIHTLNREHLEHDWPTDVISFVFENDGDKVDGEIIVSIDTATRVSKDAGWSPADELLLYVIHGLLHLAGLDDIEPEDRAAMRAAERDCLMALCVPAAEKYLDRWDSISY